MGGGGNGMEYLGQVIINSDFINVVGYGLEGNDMFNYMAAGIIDFFMKMFNFGIDGFDFILMGSVGVCLDMFILFEGVQVFLGGGYILVLIFFNLNMFEFCVNIMVEDIIVNEDDGIVLFIVGFFCVVVLMIIVDYVFVDDMVFLGSDYMVEVLVGFLMFNFGELSKMLIFILV